MSKLTLPLAVGRSYKNRDGEELVVIRIESISARTMLPPTHPVIASPKGAANCERSFTLDGCYYSKAATSPHDLVEDAYVAPTPTPTEELLANTNPDAAINAPFVRKWRQEPGHTAAYAPGQAPRRRN